MKYRLYGKFSQKKHKLISDLLRKLKSELPDWAVNSAVFDKRILICPPATHLTRSTKRKLLEDPGKGYLEFTINPNKPLDAIVEVFSELLLQAMKSNSGILRAFTMHFTEHHPAHQIGGNEVNDQDIMLFCRHLVLYILDPEELKQQMPTRHSFVKDFLEINIGDASNTHVLQ